MALRGFTKKIFGGIWLKKREYDPELVSIDDIEFPIALKSCELLMANIEIKTELKSYKSLGYRFKTIRELNAFEYNSHQIGIMLMALKYGLDLKILKEKDFFHDEITKLDKKTIEAIISELIKKFDKIVSKDLSEIMLKKENIFTPNEAGYLLYYLSFYHELT